MSQRSRIITLSILSVLIVGCIVLGVTYSFMQANIDSNSVTEVSLSSCAKITLEDGGDSINIENSYPVSRNKGMQSDPYTFTVTSSCESYVGFNLYLATLDTNTLSDSSIHYVITEHDSKEALVEGILSDATNALSEFNSDELNQLNIGIGGTYNTIYRLYNDSIPLQGSVTYDLYLFIDESVTNDTMNQEFRAGVAIKSYDREADLISLALDISLGDITISEGESPNTLYVSGGGLEETVEVDNDLEIVISGSADINTISLGGNPTNIVLNNIDISSNSGIMGGIKVSGDVIVTLVGDNLAVAYWDAVSPVSVSGSLTINGSGTLTAIGADYAAGIGGNGVYGEHGNSTQVVGDIIINSGTIIATGGTYAAGIGGGANQTNGNITINGGNVIATGGTFASGIGTGANADASGNGNCIPLIANSIYISENATVNAYAGSTTNNWGTSEPILGNAIGAGGACNCL